MGMRSHRSGGKFCSSHSSCVSGADEIADLADRCPFVERIRLGLIMKGLKPAKGLKRVKARDEGTCLLLTIRNCVYSQEVRLYVSKRKRRSGSKRRSRRSVTLSRGWRRQLVENGRSGIFRAAASRCGASIVLTVVRIDFY